MDDQEKINNVLAELKSYEPIFHHPEIFGTSKQDILAQMSDDFYEVGASGNVYTKEDIVEELLSRYNDLHYTDIWEIKDFDGKKLEGNHYLVTYLLIQNYTRMTRRSTIWRKTLSGWMIIYHQGTLIEGVDHEF